MFEFKEMCKEELRKRGIENILVDKINGNIGFITECGEPIIDIRGTSVPRRLTKKLRKLLFEKYFIPFLDEHESSFKELSKLLDRLKSTVESRKKLEEKLKEDFTCRMELINLDTDDTPSWAITYVWLKFAGKFGNKARFIIKHNGQIIIHSSTIDLRELVAFFDANETALKQISAEFVKLKEQYDKTRSIYNALTVSVFKKSC